jgi:hypothetical protein
MERKIEMITGCKTNGWTDLEIGNICTDPDCPSCSMFHKMLAEEGKKFLAADEMLNEKIKKANRNSKELSLEQLDEWLLEIFNEKRNNKRKKK